LDPTGVKFSLDLPDEVPLKQQERVYISPIWYNQPGLIARIGEAARVNRARARFPKAHRSG
jgi:hypothetical protein